MWFLQTRIFVSVLLAVSTGIRLSNVIFVIAVLFIFYRKKDSIQDLFKFTITTGIFSMLIYFPGYLDLWNSTLSDNLTSPIDMVSKLIFFKPYKHGSYIDWKIGEICFKAA